MLTLTACRPSQPVTPTRTSPVPRITQIPTSTSIPPTRTTLPTTTASLTITRSPTLKAVPSYTPSPTRTRPRKTAPALYISPTTNPQTPTYPPTPTSTYQPYPHKQVFAAYGYYGDHSIFDGIIQSNGYIHSYGYKWVIYTDGQLIMTRDQTPMMTKNLSTYDVCSLLSKFKQLGFYDIETNNKQDPTDPLYDFGGNYNTVDDGLSDYIQINGTSPRTLRVYEPYLDYVVPRMKKILQFADQYSPNDMSIYIPDRIALFVDRGRYSGFPTVLPWPDGLPSLKESVHQFVYLTGGQAAKAATQAFTDAFGGNFSENGEEYIVYAQVIFPDDYFEGETPKPTPSEIPFHCSP